MGIFKIWIGTTESGMPIVGSAAMGDRDAMACTERIYPSQMQHRCTARGPHGVQICTPTDARKNEWEIIAYFPRANGALRR